MNREVLNTILRETWSLSQLKHRLRILKENLLKTFFGGTDAEAILPDDLNWLRSLPADFYHQFTRDTVYKIFSDIEDASVKLDILTVYLSFEPDPANLAQIGSFARETFGRPFLLLDIKYDPHLIAGAAFSFGGIYRDYSLRSLMVMKKKELWEGFRKFLR